MGAGGWLGGVYPREADLRKRARKSSDYGDLSANALRERFSRSYHLVEGKRASASRGYTPPSQPPAPIFLPLTVQHLSGAPANCEKDIKYLATLW